MRRTLPIARVDVFTDRPFAGNPATAVLDADTLTEPEMQAIAGEMGTAGTGFVSRAPRPGAHFGLRMFTPTREVAYSGHTTIGAVRALLDAGRLSGDRVVFETERERLGVAVEDRADGAIIWLEPAVPACVPYDQPLAGILEVLGLPGLAGWARPAVTPDADLLLPVADLATLHALRPDLDRLGRLGRDGGLRGFCLVSTETVEPASAIHSRFFAPHFGIREDIVTGSVHSSLAVWLLEAGCLRASGDLAAFTAEQGDVLGRAGRLAVEVQTRGGRPASVRVGGRAVTVFTGDLHLP